MNRQTAEIVQFQKKQDAQFICSACGADRVCNCNAPAVERIAELKERERQKKRRQREKTREISTPVPGTDIIECPDCDKPADFWYRGLMARAGDAIAGAAYKHWNTDYGNWETFQVSTELVTLARQAAAAWEELAKILEEKANGHEG